MRMNQLCVSATGGGTQNHKRNAIVSLTQHSQDSTQLSSDQHPTARNYGTWPIQIHNQATLESTPPASQLLFNVQQFTSASGVTGLDWTELLQTPCVVIF